MIDIKNKFPLELETGLFQYGVYGAKHAFYLTGTPDFLERCFNLINNYFDKPKLLHKHSEISSYFILEKEQIQEAIYHYYRGQFIIAGEGDTEETDKKAKEYTYDFWHDRVSEDWAFYDDTEVLESAQVIYKNIGLNRHTESSIETLLNIYSLL